MADNQIKYTLTLQDMLTQKLDAANNAANRFESTMGGIQSSLNRFGAVAGIGIGLSGVKQAIMSIVDAGSQVENAQIGLGTLLKDNAAAAGVIKNTMEDATKTPFAFEGLLSANKALIAANASAGEARQTVLDLSNAIAATGGGDVELQRMVVNLQQIRTIGKASAADIKQFGFAGINIYEALGRAFGKHAEDMKGVEVTYDQLRYALRKAHEEGGIYANGLENMSNATSVGISNLGDALFQLKVRMFNDLKPAISDVLATGQQFITWLSDAWEWVKRNREMLLGLAKGILIGVAAYKLYKLALQTAVYWQKIEYASIVLLGEGFLTANAATKLFAGGLQLIKESVMSNPFGLALTAIAALTTAYFAFGGAAKDAKRENDKLNMSLKETVEIAANKIEDRIFDIQAKWKNGIKSLKGGKGPGGSIGYSAKEQMEGIARDIAAEEQMILGNVDPSKGLDFADLVQINKLKEYKKILARGPKKLDPGGAGEKLEPPPGPVTKETSKVTGNKSTTVTIHINNLVKEFTIKTVTFNESPDKAKELMTQALIAAVNDSQKVGGM